MLTGRDVSSLVVDRLCDQAGSQNTAVTCFHFDFAARKEQSATSMLGSLLKQIVSGMETIPEEISQAFSRVEKGHWWAKATTPGYREHATGHHILSTHIYMY